jgi:serine/threonine protein kinase
MWAVGFIMFELIAGHHPLWNPEVDSRDTYRENLKALQKNPKWKFNSNFSELAKTFFLHICDYRPSNRYTVETAMQHPWITRAKKGRIPLNPLEESLYLYEAD